MRATLLALLCAASTQAQTFGRLARPVAGAPTLSAPVLPTPVLSPTLSAPSVLPAAPSPLLPAAALLTPAPAAAAVAAPAALPVPAAGPAAAGEAAAVDEAWAAGLGKGKRPLEIMMAAAESYPFVKTGGLADVVDDLGRALAAEGHRVSVVLPKFSSVDEATHGLKLLPGSFQVRLGDRVETARLWHAERAGVDVYFLDNPNLYSRPGPYGYDGYDGYGKRDYPDNDERFLFHARAALEAMRFLGRKPDIVHAHDWHVGLLPALLKFVYNADPFFAAARSVLTLHNIAYQGLFPWTAHAKTGLGPRDERSGLHGMFSYLKAGVAFADALTTVSPTYAKEIQTAAYGNGLEDLLSARAAELTGILNGIDMADNDPTRDPLLARRYSAADAGPGKAANKAELQRRLGLAAAPDAPLYAVASRFAHQKGIDLVVEAADAVLAAGGQLVITGSGEPELEEAVRRLAARYPGRVAHHPFDTAFVKLVYAGADFLLMPSRFEPCGLSQLIAQRYGTLPIATKTGGLLDTIIDLGADPARGDGFHAAEFSAPALREAIARSALLYRDPAALARARRTAMAKDSSWTPSLAKYLALYRKLLGT
ncbi:MAG: glycogen synthase [Elusimicrobia bacterium]|nr:glycogen synthase [Elusimicrobiota bacterium]